jgi:hypothetical protein
MVALGLPEILELLSFGLCKSKFLSVDVCILERRKLFKLWLVEFVTRYCKITLILICSCVNNLELVELVFNHALYGFPVHLVVSVFFLVSIFGGKVDNKRVFKILNLEYNSSLLVP